MLLAFITFAETHYRRADGTTTNELDEYKLVSRHVRELYGDRPAAEFGPLALKAPVAGVTSDGQYSVRKAVAKALPSSPHPLRPFHDLREAARPIWEADRHTEVGLKKRVRGAPDRGASGPGGRGGARARLGRARRRIV